MPKPDHPPTSLEKETAMHPVLEAQPMPTVPIFTGTLPMARAKALMDAYEIEVLLDQQEFQLLIQNNPTPAEAYVTLALIAKRGKS
jgi:hypothetical protein